ncbi:MAG: hypothetical protein JSS16_02355 [Proteobacteria bacterium]|nr:hypothetical protein [Pseudomonadota bacterium]
MGFVRLFLFVLIGTFVALLQAWWGAPTSMILVNAAFGGLGAVVMLDLFLYFHSRPPREPWPPENKPWPPEKK